jgi:Cu-processing system permease protein
MTAATLLILRYELRNVLRGRWLIAYAVLLAGLAEALLRSGGSGRALLALVNLVLLIVPLVSVVFGALYLYASREFNELLLSQPVGRQALFRGLYVGVAFPLALAFALGVSLPFLWHGVEEPAHVRTLGLLVAVGVGLTAVFVALAFLVAVRVEDRARGLGVVILLWLTLAVIYDGVVLALVSGLARWPLERPMLALMLMNPIDLARVLLLLELDLSAMLGYTGAVFRRFFGGTWGGPVAAMAMLAWVGMPLALAARAFRRKDF